MANRIKIFGPPGTGKTTQLLNFINAELESGVEPNQIIYTSFTRAAANEARSRALLKFGNYHPNDFCWFSTIHSICFRLLDLRKDNVFADKNMEDYCSIYGYEHGGRITSDEGLDSDLSESVLRTDADFFEYFINWQRNMILDFETAYHKFTRMTEVPINFNDKTLKSYIERRNEYKTLNHLWDFCDMVEVVITNKICPDDVRVMVSDEYQDMTPLLVKVTDVWAEKVERYYFGGDPYQAIYVWMGASPELFIGAESDSTMVLKESHRCPKVVHDISRQIVDRFKLRYSDDDYKPKSQNGTVVRTVADMINWDDITGKTFYLHRTHWLLDSAKQLLMLDAVPFSLMRGKSPLQTKKAMAAKAMFGLINNKDITITEIEAMIEYLPSRTESGAYLKQGAKLGCKQLAHEIPNKIIRHSDLLGLGFTGDFLKYLTPKSAMIPFKMSDADKSYFIRLMYKYGISVFDSKPKIVLSTIHAVKGMECDTCIINSNLTEKTYGALIDNPDSEHRLFYVAVTRSANNLIILDPNTYKNYRI